MDSLQNPATLQQFIFRINMLTPDSQRRWGKMNVSQMLAHCSNALEVNLGDKVRKQHLMGKLLGRMAKKNIVSETPFKQGLPTDPTFIVTDHRDFEHEKKRLLALLTRFSTGQAKDDSIHPFFGKMTSDEWNTLNYKHLDHHLRQFGV
jgi:hypothetical protein